MISVVLLLVVLGGYWMLLLTPKRTAAKDAQAEVATAQTALDTARSQLTSGQKAAENFRRDRATVVKLGRVVPGTDDPSTVLVQLESAAKRENVLFSSFTVESPGGDAASATPTTETTTSSAGSGADTAADSSTNAVAPLYPPGSVQVDGGLGRTAIKVEVEGLYFSIERYLRTIQRFAVLSEKDRKTDGRLFIIDGINYTVVQSEGANKATGNLKAEVYASVYFAPPITAPAAPGGGAVATPGTATSSTTATPPAAIGSLR